MEPIKVRFSFLRHGGTTDNGYYIRMEMDESSAPEYAKLVTLCKGKWLEAEITESKV